MSTLKGMLKSKTLWANAIALVLVVVNEANGKWISTEMAAEIIAAGNFLLRFLTSKPLSQK